MFNFCIFAEDNIQQLHEIHEVIQQMRDSATLGLTHVIGLNKCIYVNLFLLSIFLFNILGDKLLWNK